jgi:hypothetical protein
LSQWQKRAVLTEDEKPTKQTKKLLHSRKLVHRIFAEPKREIELKVWGKWN